MTSSLRRWNCRLSCSPSRMKSTLPQVALGGGVDELVAPRLLHPLDGHREAVEVEQVRRQVAHGGRSYPGARARVKPVRAADRRYSSATRRSLGVFTVSQRPWWRKAPRRPRSASSGKVGRLVVAPLRQRRERLLAEDVDAAAHPVRQERCLLEARDEVVLAQLDDAEGRARMGDGDRRGAPRLAVPLEQRGEVERRASSSPFSAKTSPFLPARRRGEAEPAAAAERLRLRHGDDLGARGRPARTRRAAPARPRS